MTKQTHEDLDISDDTMRMVATVANDVAYLIGRTAHSGDQSVPAEARAQSLMVVRAFASSYMAVMESESESFDAAEPREAAFMTLRAFATAMSHAYAVSEMRGPL